MATLIVGLIGFACGVPFSFIGSTRVTSGEIAWGCRSGRQWRNRCRLGIIVLPLIYLLIVFAIGGTELLHFVRTTGSLGIWTLSLGLVTSFCTLLWFRMILHSCLQTDVEIAERIIDNRIKHETEPQESQHDDIA